MKRNELPAKEELKKYYIDELHTIEECAELFGISKNKVYSSLRAYGIQRSYEDKCKVYSNTQLKPELREKIAAINLDKYGPRTFVKYDGDTFFIKDKEYTIEWLKYIYCEENRPLNDIYKELGISSTLFYQICHHYSIKKTKEQRCANILKATKEKYGVTSTFELENVKAKSKQTCLERYGVENYSQSPEICKKKNETREANRPQLNFTEEDVYEYYITQNHSRKETASHFCVDETSLRTLLKKWDIEKNMKQVAQNSKKTFLERYGTESYFLTEECKGKLKEAALTQYGVEYFSQSSEVKERSEQTCLKKYGTKYYNQTDEFKEKSRETCLEKYGVAFATQRNIAHYEYWETQEKFVEFLKTFEKKPTLKELAEFFNVESTSIIHNRFDPKVIDEYIDLKPARSRYENEIIDFLSGIGITDIKPNNRKILDGEEIDVFVPEKILVSNLTGIIGIVSYLRKDWTIGVCIIKINLYLQKKKEYLYFIFLNMNGMIHKQKKKFLVV